MKKPLVIIFAIAIIGAAGLASRHKDDGAPLSAPSAQNQAASSTNTSGASTPNTSYKDGTYTGASEDTPYGTVQIAIVVSGGKITDVNYLQMPNDIGHSQEVTSFAEPILKQETLHNQSAKIDFVSGATTSSEAYSQSLQAALNQAALG